MEWIYANEFIYICPKKKRNTLAYNEIITTKYVSYLYIQLMLSSTHYTYMYAHA